jgi:fatty acid desaturase
MRPTPENYYIYSPEADDDWPHWKRVALNWLVTTIVVAFLALFVAALWAIWTHLWILPVIVVPILAWAFISSIKHP